LKLAILGGSFNPVHIGHLYLADTVLSAFAYDRIVLIPAFESPFKPGVPGASPGDRLDMLAASIAGDPRQTVDPCEINRRGVSYTIDTIKDIIARYRPEGKPGLVIGDDLARDFPKWREAGELARLADIIIARRILSREEDYPYPARQIRNAVMDISSLRVREAIREGKGWRYLVPAEARIIIEDRRLYDLPASGGPAPVPPPERAAPAESAVLSDSIPPPAREFSQALLVRVEYSVRESLSSPRFLHSRNTALLCRDLCLRFGLDPRAGYLAGIFHDLAKPLDGETLIGMARKDGREISELEKRKPMLLHGRAAAVLLRERFGVHNEEVLEAVAFHTEGKIGMGSLAKIVYIADKVEVSRKRVDGRIRDMAFRGAGSSSALEELFGEVLGQAVTWLRAERMDISKETLGLFECIRTGKQGKIR
jgi:nicotinate-nucleotide adenylyltransferase